MAHKLDREIEELRLNPRLPRHIAIIMDGNGRWARRRHLPRLAGHRAGKEAVRDAIRTAARLGIGVLSLYTFSLENWKRPKLEVNGLMRFLTEVLHSEFLELKGNDIKLMAMGRLDMLPRDTRKALDETIEKLSGNKGMILNLCLSYGGRAEIADAARKMAEDVFSGKLDPSRVDETMFRAYLYGPHLPDPDLLIRTSGEMRISNFLLWQIAYSEIVVLDVLWPDFRGKHLIEAIREYLRRERRFGEVRE